MVIERPSCSIPRTCKRHFDMAASSSFQLQRVSTQTVRTWRAQVPQHCLQCFILMLPLQCLFVIRGKLYNEIAVPPSPGFFTTLIGIFGLGYNIVWEPELDNFRFGSHVPQGGPEKSKKDNNKGVLGNLDNRMVLESHTNKLRRHMYVQF